MSSSTSTTGTNISEAWLVKALRLLHSQKPEDTARLRKLYKDACENEAAVTRITLAEALRSESSIAKEESGLVSERINAPRISMATDASQGDSATPKVSKVINFFDLTTATSSKNRTPGSTQSKQSSPVVVPTSGLDVIDAGGSVEGETNSPPVGMEVMADLVADLMCCVCGRMTAVAEPDAESNKTPVTNNVLVECTRCRSLYHQLCHTPPLLTTPAPTGWLCAKCSDSSDSPIRRTSSSGSFDLTFETKKSKK